MGGVPGTDRLAYRSGIFPDAFRYRAETSPPCTRFARTSRVGSPGWSLRAQLERATGSTVRMARWDCESIRPQLLLIAMSVASCGTARQAPSVADCKTIAAEYEAALPDAQICDLAQSDSCAATRPASLTSCCCTAGVNPARTGQLDALLDQFDLQNCAPGAPRVTCPNVSYRCETTASGSQACTAIPNNDSSCAPSCSVN